jgi:murein DD-endopeptidase MepM/ murein hydrolase activator NlpD
VNEGQTISQGQQIAVMGGSGSNSDNDYPLHVDLSTYIFINGSIVQLNPQALDNQVT